MKNQINRVLSNGDFKAKKKSPMTLYGGEDGKAILVGLGKSDDCTVHDYRNAGASVTATIKKSHGTEMTVRFDGAGISHMAAFAEGMMLRDYSYDEYKKKDEEEEETLGVFHKKCSRQAGQQLPQSDMRYESLKLYKLGNRTAPNCPQCAPECRKQNILRGHR